MSSKSRRHGLTAAAVLSVFSLGASDAGASGFQLLEQNASGLGNAYAGTAAVAEDASTVFFNPAGMTKLSGRQVVFGLNAIKPYAQFSNGGSIPAVASGSPLTFKPLGGDGGDAGSWAAVPNGYLTWQIDPKVTVGVGVNAPFGLKTEYDSNWTGRYIAIKSELETISINPAIAFQATDALSIGVGVVAQYAKADLTNAVNFGVAGDGQSELKGNDWGWGFNAGLLWQVAPSTRVGFNYRSSIKYTLEGNISTSTPVPITFLPPSAQLQVAAANGSAKADLKLPDWATLSVAHQIDPKWQVLADVSWTNWSTFKDLTVVRDNGLELKSIPEDWKDTWRFAVGANYQFDPKWKLRFGVAYDQSPVPNDHRTPRVPDANRTWLSIGAQYVATPALAFDFGYSYIFIQNASINDVDHGPGGVPNPVNGRLTGSYKSNVNVLGVQARYSF